MYDTIVQEFFYSIGILCPTLCLYFCLILFLEVPLDGLSLQYGNFMALARQVQQRHNFLVSCPVVLDVSFKICIQLLPGLCSCLGNSFLCDLLPDLWAYGNICRSFDSMSDAYLLVTWHSSMCSIHFMVPTRVCF